MRAASPPRDEAAYGACQQRLADALRYFLYSSNTLGPRVRALGGLSAKPLQAVGEAMLTAFADAPAIPAGRTGVRGYAATLASCYRAWDEALAAGLPTPVTPDSLPEATAYDTWYADGGSDPRYSSVHRLRALLSQPDTNSLLLRAYVHGSVATLDDVAGFSDLDLALVVRREALFSPELLHELRHLGRKVVTEMLRFDPYMHHGPHWLAEPDLAWYPAAALPPVVLEHGLRLSGDDAPLPIFVRASDEITERQLETFEQFFAARAGARFGVRDRYELEWILGSALLLPALHLQRATHTFRYKRDTFEPAERDFSPEEWSPIAAASALRAGLPRRAAAPASLTALAGALGAPELIRQAMRLRGRPVARDAREKLGTDFPYRMLRFLNAAGAGSATVRLLEDLTDEALTDLPQQTPRSTYERAIELAVERWLALPDPPRAVYQLGQVGAPGISDLDFVVVLDPGRHDLEPYAPRSFPDWARELLVHAPYFCTPETWPDLNAWFPAFDLRHLGGEDLPVPRLPPELEPGCALGLTVDFLITKVPRDLLWVARMRPLPVRLLLGMLHSVRYTAEMAERAGIPAPASASDTWQELDALRRGWHDLPSEERTPRLVSITRDVVRRALELTGAVSGALPKTASPPPAADKAPRPDSIFHFVESWGADTALLTAEAAQRNTGRTVWPNPASFEQVLGVYAEASPELGDYLRHKGCALPAGWRDERWDAGLRHHARAMTAAGKAAAGLGVPSNRYVAFGYPPTPLRLELARGVRSLVHGERSPLDLARRFAGRFAE